MTGQQILDNCRSIAQRQFEGDAPGAAQCEIELLRTKVLELAKKAESGRAVAAAGRWALNDCCDLIATPAGGALQAALVQAGEAP